MSERGIPRTFRHMHGFGSHTYSFINAQNERFWVKFTFKTQQGIQNLTDAEAREVMGGDRESNQRDLFESIERGDFPRWTLYVQIMTEAEAETYHINPFDLTKVWPHKDYPLIEVGVMELNRNPENFFADVEQAAFSPATIVPGIGFSPDKMLQGRLFSYGDTQRYRLGVNYAQIPVNAAKCPFHSYHRDGAMRVDGNGGRTPSYVPNSVGEWCDQPDFANRRYRSTAPRPVGTTGSTTTITTAGHPVPDDESCAAAGAVRQYRPGDQGRLPAGYPPAIYRQLHQGRSRLWRRCRRGDRSALLA